MLSGNLLMLVDAPSSDTAHLLSFIFKCIVAVVFVGMNVLYQLFWKNSATTDYFEAGGISQLPEDKEEYAPKLTKPHHCHCGYDLRASQNRWLHIASEEPSRCPECEREIFPDELDLTIAPPLKPVPVQKPAIKVAVEPSPPQATEPEIVNDLPAVEEIPAEKPEPAVPVIGIMN